MTKQVLQKREAERLKDVSHSKREREGGSKLRARGVNDTEVSHVRLGCRRRPSVIK